VKTTSKLRISALQAMGMAMAAAPAVAAVKAAGPVSPGGGWWWLPITLALAVGSHLLLGRCLKAVLSAIWPLASGAPEACGYERGVYGTPARAMHEIVGVVLASGVLLWIAIGLGQPWLVALSLAVFAAALALDLSRWERVSASADFVWFQRGLWQKLHQVDIQNIHDVSVTEQDAGGFSFLHGRHNRVCRLNLCMDDKRMVALPKTDAFSNIDSVEAVANHIRRRQQLVSDMAAKRHGGGASPGLAAPKAANSAPRSPSESERDMLRALKRLRKQAAAAGPPPAVDGIPPTLDGGAPPSRARPTRP
jgi:hypothetical protein